MEFGADNHSSAVFGLVNMFTDSVLRSNYIPVNVCFAHVLCLFLYVSYQEFIMLCYSSWKGLRWLFSFFFAEVITPGRLCEDGIFLLEIFFLKL